MASQFSRIELLIGNNGIKKLLGAHIAIFGIGGVGSYALEALVRCGVGNVDIIDNDKVSLTNLNRQLIALHSTIGKYKVDVAEERMLDINPELKINKYKIFFTPETEFDFSKYDYVIDAIDTVSGKLEIISRSKASGVPVISSMGAGNKMHPEMFEIADISKTSVCPLAKVIRQELKKRKISKVKVVYSKELPIKPDKLVSADPCNSFKTVPGSNAYVPSTVGLIIASEVVNELIKV